MQYILSSYIFRENDKVSEEVNFCIQLYHRRTMGRTNKTQVLEERRRSEVYCAHRLVPCP